MASSFKNVVSFFKCRFLEGQDPQYFFVRLDLMDLHESYVSQVMKTHHQNSPANAIAGDIKVEDYLCCALFEDWRPLQDCPYYRCKVRYVLPNECVAFLIDFGKEVFVPKKNLYPLPPDLKIDKIPPLAISCRLQTWSNNWDNRADMAPLFNDFLARNKVLFVAFSGPNVSYESPNKVEVWGAQSLHTFLTESLNKPKGSHGIQNVVQEERQSLQSIDDSGAVISQTSEKKNENIQLNPADSLDKQNVTEVSKSVTNEGANEVTIAKSGDGDSILSKVSRGAKENDFHTVEEGENCIMESSEDEIENARMTDVQDWINSSCRKSEADTPLSFLKDLQPYPIDFGDESQLEIDILIKEENIISFQCFYFFLCMEKPLLDNYTKLENELNIYMHKIGHRYPVNPEQLQPGCLLGVPDPDDRTACQRAEFDGLDSDNRLSVLYIDIGIKTKVMAHDAFILPKEFCTLPKIALEGSLYNVKPPKGSQTFPKNACQIMADNLPPKGWTSALIYSYDQGKAVMDIIHDDKLLSEILFEQKVLSFEEDVNEVKGMAKDWDPKATDFNSKLNAYDAKVDLFNLPESAEKPERICQFFKETGRCRRGQSCPYKHIFFGSGNSTLLDEGMNSKLPYQVVSIPAIGAFRYVEVTSVKTPGYFYCRFLLGDIDAKMSMDELKEVVYYQENLDENLDTLVKSMTDFYKVRRHSHKVQHVSPGNIVAALFQHQYQRARVLGSISANECAKVFFVDIGIIWEVSINDVRRLEDQFSILPFQALECCLHDISPNLEHWCTEAVNYFFHHVKNKKLVAKFHGSWSGQASVKLYNQSGEDLGQLLLNEGLAKPCCGRQSKKYEEMSQYIPG